MAYGEGSIQEYDTSAGKRYRVVVGYTAADGTYKQRKSSGHKTKTEAREAARNILTARDEGTLLDKTTVTFDEFVETEYLPFVRKKGRTPITVQGYEKALQLWVSPHIGRLAVQKIRMEDVQRMMDALDEEKKLSRGTIKLCLVLTQAALQLAMDKDIVLKNVAKNGLLVVPVNAPVGTKEPWSIEEAKVFLDSLSPDKDDLDLCFLLMALTGIRRGEAAGLRWGDVDLVDSLLHIRRSVQSVNGVLHVSEGGKTANSRRTVGLVDRVSELLARHKMREAERFWANGLIFGDDSPVFAGWLCKPRSPHTISTRFQAAVKRSGVRPVPLHSLRHFANTQAQFDPTVSATMLRMVMGHGSAIMTKAYTHADAEAAHLVAGSIADRLYG
jgi:integrase